MITNNKATVFLLLSVFSFMLTIGGSLNDRANATPEKFPFLSTTSNITSSHEETKYLYVGMEKCASVCHNNKEMGFQYDIVKKGPHAKAFTILSSYKARKYAHRANVKDNPAESAVCLKCHITGGGLDSASFADTYKKEEGVTCEACHKGEFVTKAFLPKEADCLKCHNLSVHKTKNFNFKEGCAKIAHPRPKSKTT